MAPRPPSAARVDTQWDFRATDTDAIPDNAFLPSWPIYDDLCSFVKHTSMFDNSQNIKMMPSSNTSTFLELRKRGNDSSTLFRTALLAPSPESRSCASSTLAVS